MNLKSFYLFGNCKRLNNIYPLITQVFPKFRYNDYREQKLMSIETEAKDLFMDQGVKHPIYKWIEL